MTESLLLGNYRSGKVGWLARSMQVLDTQTSDSPRKLHLFNSLYFLLYCITNGLLCIIILLNTGDDTIRTFLMV